MKKNIHPKYQEVLWVDTATGQKWVCGTALLPQDTEEFEGKDYPICKVPVSSASHPFFNKTKELVSAEGRVDKFRKRYTKPVAREEKKEEEEAELEDKPEKAIAKVKAPAKKATPKKKAGKA